MMQGRKGRFPSSRPRGAARLFAPRGWGGLAAWSIAVAASGLFAARAAAQDVDPTRRPTGPTPSCTTAGCHSEITRRPAQHGPVAANTCDACHQATDPAAHTFSLVRSQPDLCYFCHDAYKATQIHDPVQKGACLDCHDPHGGATRQFLKTSDFKQNCTTCHADVTHGKSNVHGPVAAGGCVACHNPHASEHKGLLLRSGQALCMECHVSVEQRVAQAASVHEPVKTDCLRCHTAHAADDRMLLVSETEALCMSCHEDIRSTVQHAKTSHGAVVQGRKCLNCHDPHASAHPVILRNNPMALCMECHNKVIDTPGGRIADMSAILATGKSLHGPVAKQDCAACHEIHGGSNFRLLVKEYPPDFYAPFKEESYALCFSCHEKAIVHDAHTTTLTGFRNGDLNLHFLHVNRETKGRTCRACHETHASDHEKHIRDKVPFGKWEMPIGFDKTASGGSCAPGCHQAYAYDRDKPVKYAPPGAKAVWPTNNAAPPPGAQPATPGSKP